MNAEVHELDRVDISRLGLTAFHSHVLLALAERRQVPKGVTKSTITDARNNAAELRAAVVGRRDDFVPPYGLGFERRNQHAQLFGFESGQRFEDCANAWVRELQQPHRTSLLLRCDVERLNNSLLYAEKNGVSAEALRAWPHALCSSVPDPLPEDFIFQLHEAASGCTETPVQRFSVEEYAFQLRGHLEAVPGTVMANAAQLLQAWFPTTALYPFELDKVERSYGPQVRAKLCPNLPCTWVVNWAWADRVYYRDSGSEAFNEGPLGPRSQAFLAMGLRNVPGVELETLCQVVAYKLSRFAPVRDRLISDQIDAMIKPSEMNYSLHRGLQT